ncbi:uncharacterized protein LOC134716733 [Mytilus trossulus]|uniref:uncharacterized protein LOC134716733 n=1 Tax=Mytilus trossulus TaxID=6551 RepID=UPI003006F387
MAFSDSQSAIRSQASAKCGICDNDRPIKWKCIDCSKLLCNHCKEKIHPNLKDKENHQVVNIKDVGQPTVVQLNINKQYQTEQPVVENISYSHDDSLWISNGADKVLQRVKPEGTKLNILSSFNTKVYDMTVTQSNNLLISTDGMKLKQISNTGTLTDSVYNVSPFISTAVHITSDNNVLVAGGTEVRRAVILMNQNGDHEKVYEHDQHKQPLFTYLRKITSTRNGNIHVVDGKKSDDRYRLVVLGQGGDIINIYTGETEINKDKPFRPTDIVTTPKDNVIVADMHTHTLHIMNNAGLLMTYYKTSDINIRYPCSLAFTPIGQLYIGCGRSAGSTKNEAKIYEVTISGF